MEVLITTKFHAMLPPRLSLRVIKNELEKLEKRKNEWKKLEKRNTCSQKVNFIVSGITIAKYMLNYFK